MDAGYIKSSQTLGRKSQGFTLLYSINQSIKLFAGPVVGAVYLTEIAFKRNIVSLYFLEKFKHTTEHLVKKSAIYLLHASDG
jgi:hypothetical protein